MDFVTIACDRDFDLMELQVESLTKYTDPCTHWIIVNERFPDKNKWKNMLEPYYKEHTLNLIFPRWYEHLTCVDGFIRHAVYKLLMVEYIDHDFVALDSKNFFIKQCNVNDWSGIVGSGRIGWDTKWAKASERYSKYFNEPMITDEMLFSETPFVFRIDRLKQLGDMRKFIKWYLQGQSCETVLYSYLVRDLINQTDFNQTYTNRTLWRNDPPATPELLNSISNNPNIKITGLHRFYIYQLSDAEFDNINGWINSLGLKTRLKQYVPSWWDKFINKKIYKDLNSGKV
jgi:hypothetical protein